MTASKARLIIDPIVDNNPVTVQILGVCSALAVTRTLLTALIMSACVLAVLLVSNGLISALRRVIPRNVRLILETAIIASAVIVADEFLKAFAPQTSQTLSVFVGLIVTNCIVLGRAEAFALHNPVRESLLDGLGHGLGYAWILVAVGGIRELWGAGTLLGYPLLGTSDGGFALARNELMNLAPSAFFVVGALIWIVRAAKGRRTGAAKLSAARRGNG